MEFDDWVEELDAPRIVSYLINVCDAVIETRDDGLFSIWGDRPIPARLHRRLYELNDELYTYLNEEDAHD